MRMVYTTAPEETFIAARDRLVRRFEGWARRQRRAVDPFPVAALLECRWADGDGLLGRWQPADLEKALLDWFPREVTLMPEHWGLVVPAVRAFVDFLVDQDLTDRRCADPHVLHTALDKISESFGDAMADQARYGLSKFWAMRMLHEGIDPTDPGAVEPYIAALRAGRITVDEALLEQVIANDSADSTEAHPPLPLVVVPDDDSLRAYAEDSPVVRQLRELIRWLGEGRPLTTTGDFAAADDSAGRHGTDLLVAWAEAAGVVRQVDDRLVPAAGTTELLADPLELARRAYAGLFQIGEAAGGGNEPDLPFGELVFAVVMALYIAPHPLHIDEVGDLARLGTGDDQPSGPGTGEPERMRREPEAPGDSDRLLDRLLGQLRQLGAIESGDAVALTSLGVGLVAGHLRDNGLPVPTMEELLDETAEVVVAAAAAAAPETAAALLTAWRAKNSDRGRAELRVLARRTDDLAHRRLAKAYAEA